MEQTSQLKEKRGHKSKAVAQAFEIASLNISIGFHQQETLRFKLRLEGAVDDVEILSSRLRGLCLQLQEKDDKLCESNEGLLRKEASSNSNLADRCTEKLKEEIPQAESAQSHLLVLDELTNKHRTDIKRLKSENLALVSQRKQEVSALIREKNFVWDQLKRMEGSYCGRLNSKAEELKQAEENLLKLQSKVDELQKAHDEKTVEATILQVNLQTLEEELQQLREELSKLYLVGCAEENKGLCSVLLKTSKESTPLIAADSIPLLSNEANGCIGDMKQNPDTLEIEQEEQYKRELQETVSQLSEFTELVDVEEQLKKTYKVVEELRLENQNLRMLYADLEVQLKDKQIGGQKSEKTNRNSAKDVTTRNLAVELEAVATISNQPLTKPAQCLVDKYVHRRTKMDRKDKLSFVWNDRVMRKLDDPSEGMLTRSCVLNKRPKATETQFSSLRRQRGVRSIEKSIRSTHSKTSNTSNATAEETKNVRARCPTGVRLSTSESKCQTDPRQRKRFSDLSDKSNIQKRARRTSIDGNACTSQIKIQSHLGQSLRVCKHKILSPRNPNIGNQKQQDPGEDSFKILPTKAANDTWDDPNKALGWGIGNNLGKNRLFSSVFNIPRIMTLNTPG